MGRIFFPILFFRDYCMFYANKSIFCHICTYMRRFNVNLVIFFSVIYSLGLFAAKASRVLHTFQTFCFHTFCFHNYHVPSVFKQLSMFQLLMNSSFKFNDFWTLPERVDRKLIYRRTFNPFPHPFIKFWEKFPTKTTKIPILSNQRYLYKVSSTLNLEILSFKFQYWSV